MVYIDLIINIISTHTLTWSVTQTEKLMQYVNRISTHTLTWSVTNDTVDPNTYTDNFNSHAHVERDNNTMFISLSGVNFNSHAHVERDYWKIAVKCNE